MAHYTSMYEDDIQTIHEITGMRIESQQDEMKMECAARLYNNLTLEQIENLEKTVEKSFTENKKTYAR